MLRCRSCGRMYPLSRYADQLDEAMERRLAWTRCDIL